MPNIFISYRREDSIGHAGRLYDQLEARFGKSHVFMDVDTIQPGEDFIEVVERTVHSCDVLIAVIGKQWLAAADHGGRRRLELPEDLVRIEIGSALDRKIRVIPVLVQGAFMPSAAELPEILAPLARRNALELPDTRFHQSVTELVAALERMDAPPPGGSKAPPQTAARRSLSSFNPGSLLEFFKPRIPLVVRPTEQAGAGVRRLPDSRFRQLFLLYMAPKWYGGILRFYFYMFSAGGLVSGIAAPFAGGAQEITGAVTMFVSFAFFAFLLRALIIRLERKYFAPQPA